MSDERWIDDGRTPDNAERYSDEALRALVRAHGRTPPHHLVEWDALASRISDAAASELAARRGRAWRGRRERAWWEVAAGWGRPAAVVAAAVAAMVALLARSPGPSSASTAGTAVSTAVSTAVTADATDAGAAGDESADIWLLLGAAGKGTGAETVDGGSTVSADSLYAAVVDAR